jgi:HlyD family secretion protein
MIGAVKFDRGTVHGYGIGIFAMATFSRLSQHRWLVLVGSCVIVLCVYFGLQWWLGPQVSVETVVRRDFLQTVVATGHVENPHRVDIGAQITGTVVRIPVSEGQAVKAKTLLIELVATELQAAERQADIAVAQAQAKLRQLQEVQAPVAEQVQRQAQASLDNARAALKRSEDLFARKFIGEAALDESRKALELADAQWRSSQKQLESTRSTGSDFAIAQTAITQAQASAESAHARARYARIAAPVDGVLISRNVEVGDVVQPGKVLMNLSPHGRSQLVLSIDEKNLHLIALGQKALASADAYPQQKFTAELVYINPGINAQTGAVEVKLDIANAPDFLRQDMTVSVDIEVARRPQALLLSAAAVHETENSTPWVLRIVDGRANQVPVRLGLRSGGRVEVLDGLQEGDTVMTGNSGVSDGSRVRVRSSGR